MPEADLRRPSGPLEVRELAAGDAEAYESFVRRHPHGLIYHSLRFRDFLLELLSCEARYGVAWSEGEVVGVLPVMVAAGPYGRVLNSLPYFGSNGGILAADEGARVALASWYDDRSSDFDVATSTMIANPLDPAPAPIEHDLVDERVGCMTALGGEGDPGQRLLATIDGSARRNVAKAHRCGVEVEVDNGAFADLEALHRAGMEAIGGPIKSPGFFRAVPRSFRADEDFALYVARLDGAIVAALLVFFYGPAAEYYVPATRVESRPEQPMAAILHRAMVDAATRGLRWWNWAAAA